MMPYPSKTSREAILEAAVQQVEREGVEKLSLRALAQGLEVAPNALYRYFADRAHLEAAIASEGLVRLHTAMAHAAANGDAEQAVRRMAKAYVAFAQKHPALYAVSMTPQVPCAGESAHEAMWLFTVGLMARLTGAAKAPEAAVALWAFLHGMVLLEHGGALGARKPRAGFAFGLEAFLAGLPRGRTVLLG